jgi:hypothetical protein
MPARIGELPCYKSVTTRLDQQDFEALTLAVRTSAMSQAHFIRYVIRQHLNTKAKPPVA